MVDKNLLYLEIIFLLGIVLCVFVPGKIFLKILLLVILYLFVIKELDVYVYNKQKYLYVGYGFIILLALFTIIEYIKNIYFIVFLICLVVIYLYLFKVLFNTTYGKVTKIKGRKVSFVIEDTFYRAKKEFTLSFTGIVKKDDVVIIGLTKFPINKKPDKILKVIKVVIEKKDKKK